MNTFQVFTYAYIISELQAGKGVLMSHLSLMQWYELSFYMTLQFENGKAYAASLTVPGFEMSASEQNATQAADWQFEDSRDHLYESGRLQR